MNFTEKEALSVCTGCKAMGTMKQINYGVEDMTEGQEAGFINGEYGTLLCTSCGHEEDWGF